MGIMKRTPADAIKAAAKAEATAAELEAKAAEATATAQRLDAEATDALVSNPEQAERITGGITAQERLARAYRVKADAASAAVDQHYRDALELQACELDAQANKMDREANNLSVRTTAALEALIALDGYAWERTPTRTDSVTGQPVEWSVDGAAGDMRGQAETLRTAAMHTRFYLKHGQRAQFVWNLETDNPVTQSSSSLGALIQPEHTTRALAAYAAGQPLTADLFTEEA